MKKRLYFCALLFVVLTGFNLHYEKYAWNNLSAISARYNKEAVSPELITEALDNLAAVSDTDIPKVTLWNRQKNEIIHNQSTGAKIYANVIEVNGDMTQVIPMTFTSGNTVDREDGMGCVLDTKTAFQLFGTTDALNNTVLWNNCKYIVRGVVKAKDTVLLIQLSDKKHLYSNVEAQYQKETAGSKVKDNGSRLSNLLVENGLNQPDAIIDGELISWLLHIFCTLPVWIFGFYTAFLLIKYTAGIRISAISCILCSFAVALILLIIKLTHFSIRIPDRFIPTKWSDFNFYPDKFSELKTDIININTNMKMPKDMLRDAVVLKSCLFLAMNLFLLFYMKLRLNEKD